MQDETQRLERPTPPSTETGAETGLPRPAGPGPSGAPTTPPPGGAPATPPPGPTGPPAPAANTGSPSAPAPPARPATGATARPTEAPTAPRPAEPANPIWARPTAPQPAQLEGAPGDPVYLPMTLSVGAGFKFGCGFMLAAGIATLLLFLVSSVVFFVASLMGLPLSIQ